MSMKNIRKTVLGTLLMCLTVGSLSAQEFLWSVDVDMTFDNREYGKSRYNWPQTIFGANINPLVGLGWRGNSIQVGVSAMRNFGAPTKSMDWNFVFFYNYRDERFNVSAGIIPRRQVIGGSEAFFCDSLKFFDNTIDGLLLQYRHKNDYVELFCDWDGHQTATERERFIVYSSGRYYPLSWLYGEYEVMMHHHAGTGSGLAADGSEADNVVDYVMLYPRVGVDFGGKLWFDKLKVSVGWLHSFQNDRTYVGHYVKPHGMQVEARIEKYKIGIYNTLFAGGSLMPYYDRYTSSLYTGSAFYRTRSDVYNRLEAYWHPFQNEKFDLKVSTVHHYDGMKWCSQQLITFNVMIDSDMFRKDSSVRRELRLKRNKKALNEASE